MKKKNDPNQLWLNFNTAVNEFRIASDNLAVAAEALTKAEPSKAKEVNKAINAERAKLNEIVRVHARHKNLHWREVWRILYARLRENTGYDAIVKGLAKGVTPLEAVCRDGKLPRLSMIAANL
jgi:hypothetical protein